jgi:hypothetical protein
VAHTVSKAGVCFSGSHKFTFYESTAGGFAHLLQVSLPKAKINLLSLRNASQL